MSPLNAATLVLSNDTTSMIAPSIHNDQSQYVQTITSQPPSPTSLNP